jgi:hypothetical protein
MDENSFQRILVGSEADQHMHKHLMDLAESSTLGLNLLHGIDLGTGTFSTLRSFQINTTVPDHPGGKRLYTTLHLVQKNENEWRFRVALSNVQHYLATILSQFLKKSANQLCILNEPLMKPTDSGFPDVPSSIVRTLDNEVYYILSGKDQIVENTIQDLLQKADPGWQFVCAMASISSDNLALFEKEVTLSAIQVLTEKVESIIVNAYDGEGYLIWESKLVGHTL